MKHLTEYRDAARVREVLDDIRRITTRPWRLMEVCGGQTHRSSATASTSFCRTASR